MNEPASKDEEDMDELRSLSAAAVVVVVGLSRRLFCLLDLMIVFGDMIGFKLLEVRKLAKFTST